MGGDYAKTVQPMGSIFFKLDSTRASGARPVTGATLNLYYVAPKDKEEHILTTFKKHGAFMEKFYEGSTEYLIACYFTTSPLFKNPLDPSEGITDEVIFSLNEEFVNEAAIGRHIENTKKQDYFADFAEIMGTYAKVVQPMGSVFCKIRKP